MTETPRDRLARYMDHRRQELGLTWDQAAARGSITGETLRQMRKGAHAIRPLTRRAVEQALEWPTGTIDRVLDGAELEEVEHGALAALVRRVRDVLDSRFSASTQVQMIRELVDEAEHDAATAPSPAEKDEAVRVTGT